MRMCVSVKVAAFVFLCCCCCVYVRTRCICVWGVQIVKEHDKLLHTELVLKKILHLYMGEIQVTKLRRHMVTGLVSLMHQTTRYFFLSVRSSCQIRPSQWHKFLPVPGWETGSTTSTTPTNHRSRLFQEWVYSHQGSETRKMSEGDIFRSTLSSYWSTPWNGLSEMPH